MRAALPLLLAALWSAPARAACDAKVPLESLESTLTSQEKALATLDFPAFDVSYHKLEEQLPCVDRRLSTEDAARVHRMHGVSFFAEDRMADAALAFAAARVLDPAWAMPDAVGVGTPLRTAWDNSLNQARGGVTPIGLKGVWVVDGVLSNERPTGWPSVIQEERNGKIYTTAYLMPGDVVQQPGGPPRPPYATPLGIAAAGALLASAGLLTGAAMEHHAFDEATTADDLYRLQDTTNALGGSGLGMGVVAVGLGVGAILSWTF